MKQKIKLFLIINCQLLITTCYAQGFNWVNSNDTTKQYMYFVKALNNKIYAHGVTINYNYNPHFPSVFTSKFDYAGNVLEDTLYGTGTRTFVPGFNAHYDYNEFAFFGDFSYPDSGGVLYRAGGLFIDSSLHKKFFYEFQRDSLHYQYSMCARKIARNRYAVIIGEQPKNDDATVKAHLRIIDTTKQILLDKTFTINNYWMYAQEMFANENGIYVIVNRRYTYNQFVEPTNLYIYKLDTLGNIINQYHTTDDKWHSTVASATLPNGDFFVGGWYSKGLIPGLNNGEFQQKYIARFDKNLNLIWRKTFGISDGYSAVNKLLISSDSTLVGCGTDGINTFNGQDSIGHGTGCIFKFSLNGESIWMHKYQAYDNFTYGEASQLLSLDELPNAQGFVGSGFFDSQAPLLHRGWVIKVDANGCLDASCTDAVKEVDANEEVFIYPNPANNEFYIQINANVTCSTLNLYNVFGALVCSTKITSNNINAITVSDYVNGFYTYQLINDKQSIVSKGKLVIEHK